MANARLKLDWTDNAGIMHEAGTTVEVDEVTLASLTCQGIVEPDGVLSADDGGLGGAGGEDPAQPDWGGPTGNGI